MKSRFCKACLITTKISAKKFLAVIKLGLISLMKSAFSEEAQKLLMNREKEFFTGNKHEQDSIKDNIRYWEHERGLDKMFLYFAPTDE